MRWFRIVVLTFGASLSTVQYVAATPVTWEASGTIGTKADTLGVLTAIPIGTPWTLDITFDPATPGTLSPSCSSPTYIYTGAISNTVFQIGGSTYSNSGGTIYTNADLPVVGCSSALGGPGLVQFQWLRGWTGGAGGANLNFGLGLLLASYNDVNAVDGSLPSIPVRGPLSVLDGLEWDGTLNCSPFCAQFTSTFDPRPVPEPASSVLLVTGLATAAIARRRRRHSPQS